MNDKQSGGRRARPFSISGEFYALVGPTASGKESAAVSLAVRHNAEILSLDSMKVFRGMDLGTAKAPVEKRRLVPHHLIDLVDAHAPFSTRRWLDAAETAARDIISRNRRPLFSGGTALYLKALLYGLFEGPEAQPALRRTLASLPLTELHGRLTAVDPATAAKVHPNDRRRVIRAIEVFETTGRPVSDLREQWKATAPRLRMRIAGIARSREDLYRRIDLRVDRMVEAGLVDEVRRLLDSGLGPVASQALGYKEIVMHLDGRIPALEDALLLVKSRTRAFARRQSTWFKHFPIEWLEVAPQDTPEAIADRAAGVFGWDQEDRTTDVQ